MYCVPGVKVSNSAGLVADVFVSVTVSEPDGPVRSSAVYVTLIPLSPGDVHVTWSLLLSDPGLRTTAVGALGAGRENKTIVMHKTGKFMIEIGKLSCLMQENNYIAYKVGKLSCFMQENLHA